MNALIKATVLAVTFLFVTIIAGCSSGDISGTYRNDSYPNATLLLNKDGTFVHDPKGSGSYNVNGDTIAVSNPMFGAAMGKIEGNKLVFPKGENMFGRAFSGTWAKQ
jgi:hypothetical protein